MVLCIQENFEEKSIQRVKITKPTNLVRQVNLWRKITNFKIKNKEGIVHGLNHLSQLFNNLKGVDNELNESQKIAILLNALPRNYEEFILKIDFNLHNLH